MALVTTVRYGNMKHRGLFSVETDELILRGDLCLVQSPRGREIGEVLVQPTIVGEGGVEEGDVANKEKLVGRLIRRTSRDDRSQLDDQQNQGVDEEIGFGRKMIEKHGLPIKLIGVEYLYRGEKIIFYFVSESRVDFRALVKDLAREYRTRIEMKQIGARDEARLLGDMNAWGRELCCRSFLEDLQPITMRMAKNQNMPLDPGRISGQCGKLKCCLRYEDEVYTILRKELPRKGSKIRVAKGVAKILGHEVLTQSMQVEYESGEREVVALKDVFELNVDESGHGTLTDAGRVHEEEAKKRAKEIEREQAEARRSRGARRSRRSERRRDDEGPKDGAREERRERSRPRREERGRTADSRQGESTQSRPRREEGRSRRRGEKPADEAPKERSRRSRRPTTREGGEAQAPEAGEGRRRRRSRGDDRNRGDDRRRSGDEGTPDRPSGSGERREGREGDTRRTRRDRASDRREGGANREREDRPERPERDESRRSGRGEGGERPREEGRSRRGRGRERSEEAPPPSADEPRRPRRRRSRRGGREDAEKRTEGDPNRTRGESPKGDETKPPSSEAPPPGRERRRRRSRRPRGKPGDRDPGTGSGS